MTKTRLLENAVDFIREVFKEEDIFCVALIEANKKESKICEETCDGLKDKCVLRYLKYYKKGGEK